MTNQEKQMKLDDEKWYASQKAGKDQAGRMDWCLYCIYLNLDKKNNPCAYGDKPTDKIKCKFPCAVAHNKMLKANK